MPAACERVMHVFTTDSFVSHHNGGEEADCGRSGLEGWRGIKKGDLEEDGLVLTRRGGVGWKR